MPISARCRRMVCSVVRVLAAEGFWRNAGEVRRLLPNQDRVSFSAATAALWLSSRRFTWMWVVCGSPRWAIGAHPVVRLQIWPSWITYQTRGSPMTADRKAATSMPVGGDVHGVDGAAGPDPGTVPGAHRVVAVGPRRVPGVTDHAVAAAAASRPAGVDLLAQGDQGRCGIPRDERQGAQHRAGLGRGRHGRRLDTLGGVGNPTAISRAQATDATARVLAARATAIRCPSRIEPAPASLRAASGHHPRAYRGRHAELMQLREKPDLCPIIRALASTARRSCDPARCPGRPSTARRGLPRRYRVRGMPSGGHR